MLIKLDVGSVNSVIEALRLHAFDDCGGKDLPTHICNIAADIIAALRALPTVSDGWEDIARMRNALEAIRDGSKEIVEHHKGMELDATDRAILKLLDTVATVSSNALGPLPAPPTIEE